MYENSGLIKSYAHAFGTHQALLATVLRPTIFGFNRYDSMFDADEETGLVEIKRRARVKGGDEVCAHAIDAPNELIWFWNSWGEWGYQRSGRSCMTFETLDRRLSEREDCTQFHLRK